MLSPERSALIARDFQTGSITGTITTTEGMPLDAGAPFSCPLRWADVGPCRVGLAGIATVTTQPVTMRLRTEAAPSDRPTVAGTTRHSFVIPVGAAQLFEEVSPAFTPGAGLGYFQITGQTASGSAGLTIANAVPFVLPDRIVEAELLATPQGLLWASTTEFNRMQWILDCDRFAGAQLKFVLVARAFKASGGTGTFRVRLGGTSNGNDGDVIITSTTAASTFDGALMVAEATVPNPGGRQLVKISSQSGGGFAWELRGASIFVEGL